MVLKNVIKIFRKELCLTQKEFAKIIGVSYATINRWENGKTFPDTTAIHNLLKLAETKDVSSQCKKNLKIMLVESRKEMLQIPSSNLYDVEQESICQLVDDSYNAVYVSAMETDELLYVNHKAEEFFNKKFETGKGIKCYEFVADRRSACNHCPKMQMIETGYTDAHILSPDKKRKFHVRGKKLIWNGIPSHAQYMTDETNALEAQNGMMDLLNEAKVGICIGYVYDDGRIEVAYLNDGYYKMLGTTREKRHQYSAFSAMQGVIAKERDTSVQIIYEACRKKQDFELIFHTKVEERGLVRLNVQAQFQRKEEGKNYYICVVTDVSRQISINTIVG